MKLTKLNPTKANDPDSIPSWLLKRNADQAVGPSSEGDSEFLIQIRLLPHHGKTQMLSRSQNRKSKRKKYIFTSHITNLDCVDSHKNSIVKSFIDNGKFDRNQFGWLIIGVNWRTVMDRPYRMFFQFQKSFRFDRSLNLNPNVQQFWYAAQNCCLHY